MDPSDANCGNEPMGKFLQFEFGSDNIEEDSKDVILSEIRRTSPSSEDIQNSECCSSFTVGYQRRRLRCVRASLYLVA